MEEEEKLTTAGMLNCTFDKVDNRIAAILLQRAKAEVACKSKNTN